MSSYITVLTSYSNISLGKSFAGLNMKAERFQIPKTFTVEHRSVSDLESLGGLLTELEELPSAMIIRGALRDNVNGPVRRDNATFIEQPCHWCMIDVDGLFWDGPNDRQIMLSHVVEQLPSEFHGVDFWYQFSSSMGIKDGVRVHLWYWLERPCSDAEMKTWLTGSPADLRMLHPIQIHLTAKPRFTDGAIDPVTQRSGMFEAGSFITAVPVPSDLNEKTNLSQLAHSARTKGNSNVLDREGIIRDNATGLAIDGRETLMFLLSNQVMRDLVTADTNPTEDEVTSELWDRFLNEADMSVVSDRGPWTIEDARSKAKARLQELSDGTYDFVSRSDKTTLVPHNGATQRPNLLDAHTAKLKLNDVLSDFFDRLSKQERPRSTVRITMGAGKTTETIKHLTTYLNDKYEQSIEVYVPRHDLAEEWIDRLTGVNANLIHIRPRTGGSIKPQTGQYEHPVLCERAEYVRDLEQKGHSIYSNACLNRVSGDQCKFFNSCAYLNQFRPSLDQLAVDNTIRIYTHASLFLSRNEYERERQPDLTIIDETFLQNAVGNLASVAIGDIIKYLRYDGNVSLGFDLVECLTNQNGDLSYLRNKDIGPFDLNAISLQGLNPFTAYDSESTLSRDVRSARLYKSLTRLVEIAARELADDSLTHFQQLAFNSKSNQIVICEHKPIRVSATTPVLYLDATADPLITDVYLPNTQLHKIDVQQLAVVSQVYDRTGSNSFWRTKIEAEDSNLAEGQYDPDDNDLSSLITVLNQWVSAGEKPLLVSHKSLHDHLSIHPHLHVDVDLAYFNALRGSNKYEDNSIIFITGRNQPPLDDIERQARVVFGASGNPLHFDDLDQLPNEELAYWLSNRSSNSASGVMLSGFSDPRISAIQRQIREAETVQAIARLRLVWSAYQKRVYLLSNLPVEMPIDHLIEFTDMIPDRLEVELIRNGNVALTPKGIVKMHYEWNLALDTAKKLIRRSKAHDPKRLISMLPTLLRTSTQIARFKAGKVRKTAHQHLYLPKTYSGEPTATTFTPWTEAEILEHLTSGWQDEEITELEVRFLFEGEPEVSG